MPINGSTIMMGATGGTITGGTSATFSQDGVEVKNGIHVADSSEADFTIRPNATFRNRNPELLPDGSYSKAKRSISYVKPKKLTSGSVVFNVARIELEMHPEMSVTEVANLRYEAAQMLLDADFTNFITLGTLA